MLLGPVTVKPLIILFGYLWPAYQSYKAVTAANQVLLSYWLKYWLIIGFYLALEWPADSLIFWLPLYHEAKLLLIFYLWHPRTGGAVTVYDRVIHPLLSKHEAQIDSRLEETKARVADTVTRQVGRAKEAVVGNTSSVLDNLRNFAESTPNRPGIPAAPHVHKE